MYHQKKDFIYVPYEPKDAEYLKRIPGTATYDEIKEYILKKYNVKVSSLYVAQVKAKHGIEMRDCYADEVSLKYHIRPDIAKAYVDALMASGLITRWRMNENSFKKHMQWCGLFVSRYLEFYDSVFYITNDETARKQLSANCPVLLRICDSLVRSYWLSLDEAFGLNALYYKYCNWEEPEKLTVMEQMVYPSETLKNVIPTTKILRMPQGVSSDRYHMQDSVAD